MKQNRKCNKSIPVDQFTKDLLVYLSEHNETYCKVVKKMARQYIKVNHVPGYENFINGGDTNE